MTRYYDIVLALIPLALVGITGVLTLTGVTLTTAVPLGAMATLPVVGHAMFVRAPSDVEQLPDAPARSTGSSAD
jgi:hypothetical protein